MSNGVSTDGTSTSTIAGMLGTAFKVAATPVFFLRPAAGTTTSVNSLRNAGPANSAPALLQ
jgi:hypothetical protein